MGSGREGLQLRDRARATKSLGDLLDGRSQLLIYHFMFGPPDEAGCTVCSSIADNLNANAPHLNAGDVTVVLVSRAPVDRLKAYKKRMGWDNLDWVSTVGDDFNRDLEFLNTEEELKPFLEGEIPPSVELMAKLSGTDVKGYVTEGPGMSAYALSDATVYRTYVTTARGLEGPAMGYYGLLDRTPKGRQESADRPIWLRRHDSIGADSQGAAAPTPAARRLRGPRLARRTPPSRRSCDRAA